MASPNADLADNFLKVAKYYEAKGDLHRPGALRKASRLIRKFPTKITKENLDEVNISKRIAERITQYLETGNMPELAAESKVEKKKSSELVELTTVFGIGLKTAEKLRANGVKDLNDLKKKVKSGEANLTSSQMVGIKYYDDFKQRVPRREVSRFGDCILRAYLKLNEGNKGEIVGSYRRGNETSGDIDILISNDENKNYLEELVEILEEINFFIIFCLWGKLS